VTLVTTLDVPICDLDRVGIESKAMRQRLKTTIAMRILPLAGALTATPAAAATFDGAWSVQIASQNKACGNGTSVSIGINNGQARIAQQPDVGNGSCRRFRQHQCDPDQRVEAGGRFGPPHGDIRIGNVARHDVLRQLDRAAYLASGNLPNS
jgi:hypothetical protein